MKDSLIVLLKGIRWPNLLIALASLIISQYLLMIPISKELELDFYLDNTSFSFLCLSVIFIMAGGYVINDHFDVNTDEFNAKFNLTNQIGTRKSLIIYSLLSCFGLLYALFLAMRIGLIQLWSIQLLVTLLLFIYSRFLNSVPLLGNLLISFLSALIVILPLINTDAALSYLLDPSFFVLHFLAILAFLSTLVREIVKDLQDFEGDEKAGKLTLAVVLGKSGSRSISVIIQSMLIIFLVAIFYLYLDLSYWNLISLSLLLILPSLAIFVFLFLAKNENDYNRISKALKLLMVFALIYGISYNSFFL